MTLRLSPRWVLVGILLGVGVLVPAPARAQIVAQLQIHSAARESIGQGRDYSYSSRDGNFHVGALDRDGDGQVNELIIEFGDWDRRDYWRLVLATDARGDNLIPGAYLNCQGSGGDDPGRPVLEVDGLNLGCITRIGTFQITALEIDYSDLGPRVTRLEASFEHYCLNDDAPLTGSFSYSDLPLPATGPDLALRFPKLAATETGQVLDHTYVITGTVVVTNAGSGTAGPSVLRLSTRDPSAIIHVLARLRVPSLRPGQVKRLSFRARVRHVPGDLSILTAIADADQQVTETNEANNEYDADLLLRTRH